MVNRMSVAQPMAHDVLYQEIVNALFSTVGTGSLEEHRPGTNNLGLTTQFIKRASLVLLDPFNADSYNYYTTHDSTPKPPPPTQFKIARKPVPVRTKTVVSEQTVLSASSSIYSYHSDHYNFSPSSIESNQNFSTSPTSTQSPASPSSDHPHLESTTYQPKPEVEVTVPLRCIGPTRALVDCPICKCRVLTRAKKQSGWNQRRRRKSFLSLYFPRSETRDVVHYCGVCKSSLVRWSSDGNVDILV